MKDEIFEDREIINLLYNLLLGSDRLTNIKNVLYKYLSIKAFVLYLR